MKQKLTSLCSLLCLSALLTGTLLQQPPAFGQRPDGGRRFGGPPQFTPEEKEKFRQKLGITVQQQEQMDGLFAESDKQRRVLGTRLRELFDQRQAVCDVYDFDRSREGSLRKEISQVYNQILKIHSDTEEKLRRILNREQFDRLVSLRKETMRTFREGMRKPPFDKNRPGGAPPEGKP